MIWRKAGLATVAIVCWAQLGGPAFAVCKAVTVSATGAPHTDIDRATSSAGSALVDKVVRVHGPIWSVGSHRNGSFHCDKSLGGRKPAWICTATTKAICAPQ